MPYYLGQIPCFNLFPRDRDVKGLHSKGPFNFKNSLNHKGGDLKRSLMSKYLFV